MSETFLTEWHVLIIQIVYRVESLTQILRKHKEVLLSVQNIISNALVTTAFQYIMSAMEIGNVLMDRMRFNVVCIPELFITM